MNTPNEKDPAEQSGHDPEDATRADEPSVSERDATDLLESMGVSRVCLENSLIDGVLVVHYATRDVHLDIDGDTAMRVLRTWQLGRRSESMADPNTSSASSVWVGIDMSHVYGLTWQPRGVSDDGVARSAA